MVVRQWSRALVITLLVMQDDLTWLYLCLNGKLYTIVSLEKSIFNRQAAIDKCKENGKGTVNMSLALILVQKLS